MLLILKNYLDAGNTDRLYTEGSHLLEMPDFEYETAGAWLLGQDAGRLVGPLKAVAPANARAFYTELLHEEIDAGVDSKLLQDMRTETPANDLRLLRSFVDGFEASAPL